MFGWLKKKNDQAQPAADMPAANDDMMSNPVAESTVDAAPEAPVMEEASSEGSEEVSEDGLKHLQNAIRNLSSVQETYFRRLLRILKMGTLID